MAAEAESILRGIEAARAVGAPEHVIRLHPAPLIRRATFIQDPFAEGEKFVIDRDPHERHSPTDAESAARFRRANLMTLPSAQTPCRPAG